MFKFLFHAQSELSLDVECFSETHMLKASSPGWPDWGVVEPLRGGAP
jgi:hypothetical protein